MAERRLDSWKEIGAYLKRDVATVRRWEKREGLPVHRHHHEKLGSVYADTSELDAWLEGRRQRLAQRPGTPRWRRPAVVLAGIGVLVAAFAGLAYQLGESDRGSSTERPRIRVAVHRPGTVASLIADGLVDVLNRTLVGVDVEAVELPGMVHTLRALDSHQVDLGLAFNLLAFHAVKTEQLLGHRSDAITAIALGYATPAQIVTPSGSNVRAVTDLKGSA